MTSQPHSYLAKRLRALRGGKIVNLTPQEIDATLTEAADALDGPNGELTHKLLEEAYRLYTVDDVEIDSDESAWREQTRCLLQGLCPYPITPDDGTQKECIANGHCGCVFGKASPSATHAPISTEERHG